MGLDREANQWALFGYDMRSIGRLWQSAWSEFLFAEHSPLRQRLDEPVRLIGAARETASFAGRAEEQIDPGELSCVALEVPEHLFLARTISLPLAAVSELEAVLAIEISANSPFEDADTVRGWKEVLRSEDSITVLLVVAARSALMQWISEAHADHRAADVELWARHGDTHVLLRGFGEGHRDRRYRRRLLRVGSLAAGTVILLYLALGLFALQQRVVLQQVDALQRQVAATSAQAADQREALIEANRAIEAANALVQAYPNPHVEMARLTRLLGDEAYLAHFSMRGRDLRLRGRARDAAAVMQTLSQEAAFAGVTAPQAITAVGNSGLEQFYLDVEIAAGPGGGGL